MVSLTKTATAETRLAPAPRTRLRPGKLFKLDMKPLCECTLYDLANGSTGIVIPDGEAEIPEKLFLLDTRFSLLCLARVHWRMGPNLGIAFLEDPVRLSAEKLQDAAL